MDLTRTPARIIPLPTAGDPWAQPGAQTDPPSNIIRLVADGGPMRWRVIGYDGTGPDAAPVDGDATTVDMTVVKIRTDRHGNTTLARTASLVETGGVELEVGKQISEDDVSQGEVVLLGLISATQDTAAALWIFVDSGASVPGGVG